MKHPGQFRNRYAGPCYIVGKGPSLDNLKQSDLPDTDAPVIGVNHAFCVLENLGLQNPIYGIQYHPGYTATTGTLFICMSLPIHNNNTKVFKCPPRLTDTPWTTCAAVDFAKYFGCTSIVLLCCDAVLGGSPRYGTCIGFQQDSKYDYCYGLQKQDILDAVGDLPLEWVIPKGE